MSVNLASQAASHPAATEPAACHGRFFQAPVAPSIGKTMGVAVMADPAAPGPTGDSVARLALDAVQDYLTSQPTDEVGRAISGAFVRANDALVSAQTGAPGLPGPDVGLTIVVFAQGQIRIGHAGRGHVYLLRDNQLQSIVPDRTWVRAALDTWEADPTDIREIPNEPGAGSSLGRSDVLKPVITAPELSWPGDLVLVCTSSMVARLRDEQIRAILTDHADSPAARLVDQVVANGEIDAVTALVITVPVSPIDSASHSATGIKLSKAVRLLILGNLALVAVIAAIIVRGRPGPQYAAATPTIQVATPASLHTTSPTSMPSIAGTPAPTLAPTAPLSAGVNPLPVATTTRTPTVRPTPGLTAGPPAE